MLQTNVCFTYLQQRKQKKKSKRQALNIAIAGRISQLSMIHLSFVYIYQRKLFEFVWLAQEPIWLDRDETEKSEKQNFVKIWLWFWRIWLWFWRIISLTGLKCRQMKVCNKIYGKFWIHFINMGYHINPKYSHLLLFTSNFSSTSSFSYLWMCVQLLGE